jgi:hypothetical protein
MTQPKNIKTLLQEALEPYTSAPAWRPMFGDDPHAPPSAPCGVTQRFLCAFTVSACCTATVVRICTLGTPDTYECQDCRQTCDPQKVAA